MKLAKITSKGQITIPAAIRKAAQLKESDMLAFEIKGDHLVVRKITFPVDVYLNGVSEKFASQRRPALVVSPASFNDQHDHLVLAMITTAKRTRWVSDSFYAFCAIHT